MRKDLRVQEIFVTVERIIGRLERLVVKPVNTNEVVDWTLEVVEVKEVNKLFSIRNEIHYVKVQPFKVFFTVTVWTSNFWAKTSAYLTSHRLWHHQPETQKSISFEGLMSPQAVSANGSPVNSHEC